MSVEAIKGIAVQLQAVISELDSCCVFAIKNTLGREIRRLCRDEHIALDKILLVLRDQMVPEEYVAWGKGYVRQCSQKLTGNEDFHEEEVINNLFQKFFQQCGVFADEPKHPFLRYVQLKPGWLLISFQDAFWQRSLINPFSLM